MAEVESTESSIGFTSNELLTMGGFGLFFAWMFVVFFWLFCEFPPGASLEQRNLLQLVVFAAMPVGYVGLHLLSKKPTFNVFALRVRVTEAVSAVILPLMALLIYLGVHIPLAVVGVAAFMVGMAAASIMVSWLDVCSRLEVTRYSRVTGLSFFIGGLLFAIISFSPTVMQPLFSIAYILASVGLLRYASKHAPRNDERAPLESVANTWRFVREIEPSFFMFGMTFGMTFVFLFNSGSEAVMLGLISTFVGAIAAALISIADRQASIIDYQRGLVVVMVIACVAVPYFPLEGQIAISCAVMTAWSLFMSINYGYIVKKCVIAWEAPLFRQAPLRLIAPALGLAVGWAAAALLTLAFGAHSDAFTYLRLTVAVLLVATVMIFFPSRAHHPVSGMSPDGVTVQTTVVAVDRTEAELFEERIASVAKLFQLSPRETEVLGYLARGRNAAYIQEALVISPHTVKSHIYNIYRKLDIHSQQKLMDFVEEFPLD